MIALLQEIGPVQSQILSKDLESMKILAQSGEFANRKGIYPPIDGVDRIQYIQMDHLDAKAFEEKKKEYAKIFRR